MDHTHVQQFLREHYHNDGINKSSCARGAPPKMKKHSVPVAFARVARGKKEHILQAESTRVIQGSPYDSGLSSPERLFRPESYGDPIMETKKRCAYVLSIPHHLWEEVSDFPLLYQEDKMAKLKEFERLWLENVIQYGTSIASDGQTATITFDNLQVSLDEKNSALVATQVASFILPIIENDTEFHVKLFISGFVFAEPGTRAILVAHLGDTTAIASSSKPLGDAQGFVSDKPPTASSPETPGLETSYVQALEATLPAGVDVQTTLFLLAERNDKKPGADINVLALDFNLGELDSGKA